MSSVQEVLNSQEIYRLKRTLQSSGDIFEIDSSARAIWIGPNSDVAEVTVLYANDQEPNQTFESIVAPNGPWVGRMDANLVSRFPATGDPKRILAFPTDIVDPDWEPPQGGAGTNPFRIFNVPINLDLIVSLKDIPNIPNVRADRTIRLPQVPFENGSQEPADNGSTTLVIPVYGRKLVSTQIVVPQARGLTIVFEAVTVIAGTPAGGATLGSDVIGSATVAQTRNYVVRASNEDDSSSPLRGPQGQFDLLTINLSDGGAGNPDTTFVDLFIRLSDRE